MLCRRALLAALVLLAVALLVVDVWFGARKAARFVGAIGELQSRR